ncbi:MAG: hypothetical protein ACRYF3_17005 [Janthinobacterium lividum]
MERNVEPTQPADVGMRAYCDGFASWDISKEKEPWPRSSAENSETTNPYWPT